jgi:hypothetical protein
VSKYAVEHLTTEEIKAVCAAIQADIMTKIKDPDAETDPPILNAPADELQEEYAFWAAELEKRLAYASTAA